MTEDDTRITSTADAEGLVARTVTSAVSPYDVVEALAVVLALLAMFRVLSVSAGRDADTIVLGLVLTAPAVLLTRPWRAVRRSVVLLVALVPVTAVLICYIDPLQFSYTKDLAVWAYGPMLFLVGAGFARDAQRRLLLVVTGCLLVVWAVVHGLQPWFEFNDPTRPLVGTFYWHNQMGTFSGVGALVGLALVAAERGPVRLLGALAALLGGIGLTLSTSRASAGFCALALVALSLILLRRRRWRRCLLVLALVAASVAAAFALRAFVGSNGAATQPQIVGSAGSRPLETNLTARFQFWKAAVAMFADHPVKGEGHGTFLLELPAHMPAGAGLSRWTHNGVLNAAADGGLLFGLPVALAALMALAIAGRVLVRALHEEEEPARVAAALAVATLVAHALFDFDWIYPILAGTLGLLAGVLVPAPAGSWRRDVRRDWLAVAATVLTVSVGLTTGYTVSNWQMQQVALGDAQAFAASGDYQRAFHRLEGARRTFMPNPQLDAAELSVVVRAAKAGHALPPGLTRKAVRRTASLARVDPDVAQVRIDAMRLTRG